MKVMNVIYESLLVYNYNGKFILKMYCVQLQFLGVAPCYEQSSQKLYEHKVHP